MCMGLLVSSIGGPGTEYLQDYVSSRGSVFTVQAIWHKGVNKLQKK